MPEYTAPVRDMRFVLDHVADLSALAALDGYDHADREMVGQVLDEAGRLANQVLSPLNRVGDVEGVKLENGVVRTATGFPDAYRQFIAGGWNGVPFDPDYGGGGLPWAVAVAVAEIWNGANMAFAVCPLLTQGAIELIHAHGSEQQKATYLEKLVAGEWTGTMKHEMPRVPGGASGVRASTMWMMLSVRSCSP